MEYAINLVIEPSSCLTSGPIFEAIYSITSSGISCSKLPATIFFFKISVLSSNSGGNILTVNPQQNLVLKRSSRSFKSSGDLSEDIIICLLSLYKLLNVWKNSC